METNRIPLRLMAASIAAVVAIEAVAGAIPHKHGAANLIFVGIVRVAESFFLIAITYYMTNKLSPIGLGKNDIMPGFKKGILWSVGFGFFVLAAFLILWIFKINALKLIHMNMPGTNHEIAVLFIVGGILGPVGEEIFFRGILYGFFRQWGVFVAISLTTLFFVMLHSSAGFIQIAGGILFAISYEKEGKLLTPITIHVLGNSALFTLSLCRIH